MTVDEATTARLRAALTSPDLHIVKGLGSLDNGRCTMAEVNLILTGRLSDEPHPCVSEVVRQWVIRIQDAMPDDVRNSAAWREAAVGIAGSAVTPEAEQARAALLLDWMWARLGDEAVLASIPVGVRPKWDAMLLERTLESARKAAAYAGARAATYAATYAARAATYAARAATYAADAVAVDAADAVAAYAADAVAVDAAYWARADCPGMLAKLTKNVVS